MAANADALRDELRAYASDRFQQAVESLPDRVRPEAPISTPTPTSTRPPGELRASIQSERLPDAGDTLRMRLFSDVIQAATTDRGAVPHVIMPRNARVLRFWWANGPLGAGIYHLPRVNHPGNAPMNWWQPAIDVHWPEALEAAFT